MENIVNTLWEYTNNFSPRLNYARDQKAYFHAHKLKNGHLKKFLFATNDETRLYHASEYVKQILITLDSSELDFFRKYVLRKEITADVFYDKQRDHSAHTLYNYLLGSYLFENSSLIKEKFSKHISGIDYDYDLFINMWPYVSLLHDIGYMFEGALYPLSSEMQSKQIKMGADSVNDFFEHNFWESCQVLSLSDRKFLLDIAEMDLPKINTASLSTIADDLSDIGNTNNIKSALYAKEIEPNLPSNAFELWHEYFVWYKMPTMRDRVKSLKMYFEQLINVGMANTGLRILDHGVCSGLILLKYTTFYYNLHFGIQAAYPNQSSEGKKICNNFFKRASLATFVGKRVQRTNMKFIEYPIEDWWKHWVHMSASTAFHNFLQSSYEYPDFGIKKISLKEDPMTYLGVLVDVIEEWDRYNTTSSSVMTSKLPLQGIDVFIRKRRNTLIEIKFPNSKIAEKVKKDLSNSLLGWKKIINII